MKKLAAILPANNISLAGNDDFTENDAAVSANMKGADLVAALADKGACNTHVPKNHPSTPKKGHVAPLSRWPQTCPCSF